LFWLLLNQNEGVVLFLGNCLLDDLWTLKAVLVRLMIEEKARRSGTPLVEGRAGTALPKGLLLGC